MSYESTSEPCTNLFDQHSITRLKTFNPWHTLMCGFGEAYVQQWTSQVFKFPLIEHISSSGVIEGDAPEDSQIMGDPDKEVTDEERDQSDEKRSEAMRAFSEQQYDEAIKLYNEAIQLNPQSALLFAKRGQVCCII